MAKFPVDAPKAKVIKAMEEWVWQVINTPETKWQSEDGNMHYSKAIPEKEGRILHVVVNIHKCITQSNCDPIL